jgi:hypothetical protein
MEPPVNRPTYSGSAKERGPQSAKGYPSSGGVWTPLNREILVLVRS